MNRRPAFWAPTLVLAFIASVLLATPAGASEPWVERAQQRLNALRCDSGPVDGVMGRHTRSAIHRFQSRHGLAQTGELNDATRQRLYSATAKRCDLRPVPARSGTGRRIVLSQRQNWVWLVGPAGGVVAQGPMIDNPAEVSPGTYRSGSYCGRAGRIAANRSYNGLILRNFVRWAPCGIGFHRVPQYESGAQIHADWLLGTNLDRSAGCIRLTRGLSRRIWDFTTTRTTVRVK